MSSVYEEIYMQDQLRFTGDYLNAIVRPSLSLLLSPLSPNLSLLSSLSTTSLLSSPFPSPFFHLPSPLSISPSHYIRATGSLDKVKSEASIVHWLPLNIIIAIVGWIYFAAWSISFYPQVS